MIRILFDSVKWHLWGRWHSKPLSVDEWAALIAPDYWEYKDFNIVSSKDGETWQESRTYTPEDIQNLRERMGK